MSAIKQNYFVTRIFPIAYLEPQQVKKWALVALSTILALGMIFSYAFGAPWAVIFLLFVAALIPVYPIRNTVNEQRHRIQSGRF